MKKLMFGLTPLLAVAALMAAPAMASAETTAYGTCATGTPETKPPCKAGETFTAFPNKIPENVLSEKAAGSGNFVLELETTKDAIECSTFSDKGVLENVAGVGHSTDKLTFDDCVPVKELGIGCTEINPTKHEIKGEVTDLVTGETKVEVKIPTNKGVQFDVTCVIGGIETDLKGVTGAVKGTAKGNELAFAKAKGLEFNHEKANITGTDATKTETGEKLVLIN